MHRALYFLLLLVVVTASPAAAQLSDSQSALVPGQRARVTYQRLRRPLIGEFVSSDEHALVIRKPGVRQPYYITWDKIARIEESVDQRSRRQTIVRATAAGFLVGVALGVSATAQNELIKAIQKRRRSDMTVVSAYGIGITTLAGGLLGITWPKDVWEVVPLHGTPPRLTIRPLRRSQVGLGLSFGD